MINVGILGTARIARAFFGMPMRNARFVAIASRQQSSADAFGNEFNIPRRYGSYEALLADAEIEAVYIPLPQHLHCEYTTKAAEAGKHVLVEKPAALTSTEVRSMTAACDRHGVLYTEGFMYRFKSIMHRVKELVQSGELGKINYIDFNWCFEIKSLFRSPFRVDRKLGGGAMYDLGVYGIDFTRFVTGHEPRFVHGSIYRESKAGADMFTHIEYKAGDVVALTTTALNTDANYISIGGTKGSLFARAALAGRVAENVLQIHTLGDDGLRKERFPPENPYIAELEYFARCIEQKERPFPDGENSLKNILLLEEVFAKSSESIG